MPLRKIRDLPRPPQPWSPHEKLPCMDPAHNPLFHMVMEPGVYEYECPGCGEIKTFIVRGICCGTPEGHQKVSPYDASQGGAKVLKGRV